MKKAATMRLTLFTTLLFISSCRGRAPSGPWDQFNYAPSSRTVLPVAVHSVVGTVDGADGLVNTSRGGATLSGDGSYIVLDFGKEVSSFVEYTKHTLIVHRQVGGIVSLNVDNATSSSAFSLSFTESPLFISPTESDDSSSTTFAENSDGVETVPAPLAVGLFTQPPGLLRGGFRYLTIVSNANDSLTISNVTLAITFMPHWGEDLTAYTGYFSAEDPVFSDSNFLTKLWYAGAYTVQTNTIGSNQARQNAGPTPG